MKLVVVGSGRCGTQSVARLYQTEHEPNKYPVVSLAAARSHGWIQDDSVSELLELCTWPEVVVDFKQSELIDVTADLYPDAKYLWLVRNPADTVASMVQRRWYLPNDDNYPHGAIVVHRTVNDQLVEVKAFNQSGNRTRGDLTGDFTFAEWSNMNQIQRCGWWYGWINKRILEQLTKLDPDRTAVARIEDTDQRFAEWLTGTSQEMPRINQSHAKPVTGWEPYVEETAAHFGYPIH